MSDRDTGLGTRTCPSCGAVVQEGLDDQFFCEYCGSPLGEEEPLSVLPDWLQDVPAEGDGGSDDALDWLDSLAGTARSDSPTPTRIELRPTGASRARASAGQQPSGVSCTLVLGIIFFLAALCLLGWVLFAIVRSRAPEPASSLTLGRLVWIYPDQPRQHSGTCVSEKHVVLSRTREAVWGGGPRSHRILAAGLSRCCGRQDLGAEPGQFHSSRLAPFPRAI